MAVMFARIDWFTGYCKDMKKNNLCKEKAEKTKIGFLGRKTQINATPKKTWENRLLLTPSSGLGLPFTKISNAASPRQG